MEEKEPTVFKRKNKENETVENKHGDETSSETSKNQEENQKMSSKEYTQAVAQWLTHVTQHRMHQWVHYCSQHALMVAPYFFGTPFPPFASGNVNRFPGAPYGGAPLVGVSGEQTTPQQQADPSSVTSSSNVQGQQPPPPQPGQVPFPAPLMFPFQQPPPAIPNGAQPATQQQQQRTTQPHIPQLAASEFTLPSLYRRITAEIIDFILLFIMKFGVTLFIIEYMGIVDPSSFMMRFLIEEIDEDSTFEDLQQMLIFALIYRAVVCTYETFFLRHGIGIRVGGATPGKYCMGLRVVSCDRVQSLGGNRVLVTSPENMTYLQAFLRAIIKNFSMAFFFPACITVFFNPHFRAAYDILTRTMVVSVPNWAERLRPQRR